jgi:hypothetical protein
MPGGLGVVFDRTVGNPAAPFFAVMKAELHEGFVKTNDLQAQFVSDLFPSPQDQTLQIGIFVSDGASHVRNGNRFTGQRAILIHRTNRPCVLKLSNSCHCFC